MRLLLTLFFGDVCRPLQADPTLSRDSARDAMATLPLLQAVKFDMRAQSRGSCCQTDANCRLSSRRYFNKFLNHKHKK